MPFVPRISGRTIARIGPNLNSMTLNDRASCPHLRRAAEEVEGLSFRGLSGPSDAEIMSRVSHLSWKDDGVEWLVSPEDIRSRLEDKSGDRKSVV